MEVKYYFSSCSQNETEPHTSTGTASLHLYSLVPPPSLAHTEMCIPLLQNRMPGTSITNYYLLDHRSLCPSFSVPRAIQQLLGPLLRVLSMSRGLNETQASRCPSRCNPWHWVVRLSSTPFLGVTQCPARSALIPKIAKTHSNKTTNWRSFFQTDND